MSHAETPALVQHFDLLRDSTSPEAFHKTQEHPYQTSEDLHRSVQAANEAWQNTFDLENFLKALKEPLLPKNAKYLKQVRKFGLVLKTAHSFMSEKNRAPTPLKEFLTYLGHVNDDLERELVYPQKMDHLRDLAQKMDARADTLISDNEVRNPEQFHESLQQLIHKIEDLLSWEKYNATRFHDLRKAFRTLMNLIQIPAALEPFGTAHFIFLQMHKINQTLGKAHDEAVELSYSSGFDAYQKKEMPIFGEQKEIIRGTILLAEEFLS